MNNDINLILDGKKQESDKIKRLKQIRIVAGVSLCIIILSVISLFLLNQFSGIESLLQKEKEDTAKISSRQKIVGKLLLLQSRLTDINTILLNRSSPDIFIQQIIAGMPADVHIDSVSLTKKRVSLTLNSSSLFSLDQFTNYLLAKANNKELFKTFIINSVVADPKNQKYILSFDTDLL